MHGSFTQIDLSRLPAPDVIEALDYESILAEMKAAVITAAPEMEPVLALETEPSVKLLQVCAYRELLIRARINDAALALLLARATGADLDNLAANYGVARLVVAPATENAPAIMEQDGRLRRRVLLAMDAYSVAGPAGAYEYHALTAVPSLHDATAVSTEPGRVTVTLMSSIDEPEPSVDERAKVALALSDKTVRPLTDVVSVASPLIHEVAIDAELTIYPGPDGSLVAQNARKHLESWLTKNAFLGRDLRRSAVISRLHVEGVQSVELIAPAADVIAGKRDAIKITSVNLSIVGGDE